MARPFGSQRQTARELVADFLRRLIITGELKPGERVNVNEISDALNVSQTPTREAFHLLSSEGLLRQDPYRGVRVTELSPEIYEEIFLQRVELEALAARLGSERIDESGIEEMESQLAAMQDGYEAGDIEAFLEHDREFHRVHYLASGRETLWERIISLRFAAERYTRAAYLLPRGGMADTLASHRLLVETARSHEGERAAEILRADLRRTFESFVSSRLSEASPAGTSTNG